MILNLASYAASVVARHAAYRSHQAEVAAERERVAHDVAAENARYIAALKMRDAGDEALPG